MIESLHGNIFESRADMLVNPVNTLGTMGKGLAKQFREMYPGIWQPYYEKCRGFWKLGEVLTLANPAGIPPFWIVCYPTKLGWRRPSSMGIIEKGMPALFDEIAYTGIKSIALPALGAGLGQIPWAVVKRYLLSLPWPEFLTVKIYEPHEDGDGKATGHEAGAV